MPAVSKKQQQFFAIMEHNPKLAKQRGINMTKGQMRDFAATSTKNLPMRVPRGKKK